MPVYKGKHLGSKKECLLELTETTSIEETKKAICVKLGLESSDHHVLYKGQIVNDQNSLKDLDVPPSDVDDVVLLVHSKEATPELTSKLGSGTDGVFGCAHADVCDGVGHSKVHKTKFADPRNWSLSENSSVISRVEQVTCRNFNAGDRNKISMFLAAEIQSMIDSLSYNELEYLAADCLKKKQIKMENLRDEYYDCFEVEND